MKPDSERPSDRQRDQQLQRGGRRAALLREQALSRQRAPEVPDARCGGCRGRRITR